MSQENITGGAALDALLQSLPQKLETNIMRSALRAGAKVYFDEVYRNIPVEHGDLRASARISTRVSEEGQVSASVKVGNRRRFVFYAHMVEFGTRPHLISPKGRTMQIGGQFVAGTVQHPGARPHPFMRPAADAKFTEAVAAVQTQIRKRLTKEGLQTPPAIPPDEAAE